MKRLYFLLIVSVIIIQNTFAQNWTFQSSNTNQILWSVTFLNENTGIVVGDSGVILKTSNGGNNWLQKNSATENGLALLQFINSNIGYVSGINGPLLKTTDAGESWNIINFSNLNQKNLGGFWFTNESNGVIALAEENYSNSKILRTTDGGANWDTVYTPNTGFISYFNFPNPDTGYCTVSGGKVYKTTDNGNNWITQNIDNDSWLSGIYFFDGKTGFVGGVSYPSWIGKIYKTTDGGSDWQEVLDDSGGIGKIYFCDQENGFAVVVTDTTQKGVLIKTTSAGADWTDFETPTDSLNGLFFFNPNLGYVVGDKGRILKYDRTTRVENKSELISKYALYQNYPNPFNPSTTIKYSIPKLSFVTLKIFDVLGNEIAILVNEEKTTGNYKVEFDASNLSSGVYFYRLQAGDFIDTKKIVLLK